MSVNKKLDQKEIKSYLSKLLSSGEDKLLNDTILNARLKLNAGNKDVDVELLDLSNSFFSSFRKTGDETFFTVGKILRKAAHIIFRLCHKTKKDQRFLRLIKG